MSRKNLALGVLVFLLFVGCQATPETVEVTRLINNEVTVVVPVTEEVTRIVTQEVTRVVETTRVIEIEQLVTFTPLPINTPMAGPTPIPTITGEDTFALNCVAEQESSGVVVRVHRVFVARKVNMPSSAGLDDIQSEVIAQFNVSLQNLTDRTVEIYPDRGTVQVGSELVDLNDYFLQQYGDDLSGDLFPGVVKYATLFFGINRSSPDDIMEMIFRFDAGTISSEGDVTADYELIIDLSEHRYDLNPGTNQLLELCF